MDWDYRSLAHYLITLLVVLLISFFFLNGKLYIGKRPYPPPPDSLSLQARVIFERYLYGKKSRKWSLSYIMKNELYMNSMDFLRSMYNLSFEPPLESDKPKPSLILDLDETLIFSRSSDSNMEWVADRKVECLGLSMVRNGREHHFFTLKRPYLDKFLQQVSLWYEVTIFTAGERPYADAVINAIDPKSEYISKRLFRNSCTMVGAALYKDIGKASNCLEKTIVIDNNPSTYKLNPYNAIPINSWIGAPNDRDLVLLLPLLRVLRFVDNVPATLYPDEVKLSNLESNPATRIY